MPPNTKPLPLLPQRSATATRVFAIAPQAQPAAARAHPVLRTERASGQMSLPFLQPGSRKD